MKRLLFIITLFFLTPLVSSLYANQDSISFIVKQAILNDDMETALIHLSDLEADSNTYSILKKQAQKDNLTPLDYVEFIKIINNTRGINVLGFSSFIDRNIPTPPVTEPLNYNYALIKWQEITWLVDESKFDKAAIEQQEFQTYINAFNPEERDSKRASVLLNTYHLVMHQIQAEAELGIKKALECEAISISVQDTSLILLSRYYFADFLIFTGELDLFIETSEKSIQLENEYSKTSDYYSQTIMHLIDAYLFKGGYLDAVFPLLIDLLNDPTNGATSYSYIVNYLEKINIPCAESDSLFSVFDVKNIPEFCEKIDSLSKEQLNTMDYYYVLYKLSELNNANGDLKVALAYLHRANSTLKKTYNQDLAESLANYETTLLKESQKQKLEIEHQKSQLSIIISILSFLLFLITVVMFWQRNKKEKQLQQQNNEITQQRDDIKKREREKALLLKEIHHRVKNNFQIVSSLLELQSSNIKDEQAKALVKEGKNRISSMALIHKKLYENEDLKMRFDEYVTKLVYDLSVMYNKVETVNLQINIPAISFDIDTAIPLGLIINELVTNGLKYGLTHSNPALSISIEHVEDNNFKLIIKDNGDGLPDDFSVNKLNSLGLKLVTGLSQQIQGKFSFTNDNGGCFMVTFKDDFK